MGTMNHIIPKIVRKSMGWTKKKTGEFASLSVPVCRRCHDILTELQKPLVLIIKSLRTTPPVPLELALIMERIKINLDIQSSEGKANG